jgi:hypothetical protein
VVRGDAKWGGQAPELFNETQQSTRSAAAVFAMLSQAMS